MKNVDVKKLLTNLVALLEDQNMWRARDRISCVIEGVMLGSGILEPGVSYDYKQITVENPNALAPWFPGIKPTIIRREQYHEMIIRIAKLYLSLTENQEK